MNHAMTTRQAGACAILAAEIDGWNRQLPGLVQAASEAENDVIKLNGRKLQLERRIEQLKRTIEAASMASNFPARPGHMGSAALIGATIALANTEAALPRAKLELQRAIARRDAAERNVSITRNNIAASVVRRRRLNCPS